MSIVVSNISDSPIYLKEVVQVAHVVSASLDPPAELSPEMEAALGAKTAREPMTVTSQLEKLLEKLNLDGLSNWTPINVAAAKELVLAFHDIFALDGNELGSMSAIEHKIHINNSQPFKEWFRHIPPRLLEEVHASLRDMLDAGVIRPSQSPWCNVVVLVWKNDGSLCFCIDFRRLNAQILASKDRARVLTVYHLHGGKSGILRVYSYALWALQHPCNFSMPHAEHLVKVELDLLHHVFG